MDPGWADEEHNRRRMEIGVQEALVLLGTEMGYEEAAQIAQQLGVWVSAQTVRRVSQGAGRQLAVAQREHSTQVQAGEVAEPDAAVAVGQRVEIAVDGQWVREHPSGQPREVKTAVVRVRERGKDGVLGRVLHQEYHSAWEPAEAFGAQVYAGA
ncbi:MAG: hypothetical protein HY320_15470 [Armatimonadetes bacterium]|nr:hypothetical protein [Armatimonadota bacterium]